jgi:hypothetical protein
MNEREMRELDEWIAKHVFGWRVVDLAKINDIEHIGPIWWPPKYGNPLNPEPGAMPHPIPLPYSSSIICFSFIKREIERRGWSWMATGSSRTHEFAIWDHVMESGRTPAGFAPEIGRAIADTEELAGCLAFKAAGMGMIRVPEGESITLGDHAALRNVIVTSESAGDPGEAGDD